MSCDCSVDKKRTRVERLFKGTAPAETIDEAIEDAELYVENFIENYSHNFYDILVKYYACHLLHSWGFAKTVTSTGIGPASESRQVADYGDKEGADPYITEFRKWLGGDNELIATV